jgi:hypothetical protein
LATPKNRKRIQAGSVRSPEKKAAARRRFRASTTRALCDWLASDPAAHETLLHPDLRATLTELHTALGRLLAEEVTR